MQQQSNSLHQELTPEYPATSLPDQPSCRHHNLGEFKAGSVEIPLATDMSHFTKARLPLIFRPPLWTIGKTS